MIKSFLSVWEIKSHTIYSFVSLSFYARFSYTVSTRSKEWIVLGQKISFTIHCLMHCGHMRWTKAKQRTCIFCPKTMYSFDRVYIKQCRFSNEQCLYIYKNGWRHANLYLHMWKEKLMKKSCMASVLSTIEFWWTIENFLFNHSSLIKWFFCKLKLTRRWIEDTRRWRW